MGSGTTHQTDRPMATFDKKKFSTSASAKELPVWLVGTFLLLHCEEMAYLRNLSGQDERRFYGNSPTGADALAQTASKVDFTSLLKNPSLSPRYDKLRIYLVVNLFVGFYFLSKSNIIVRFGATILEPGFMLVGTMTIHIARLICSVNCARSFFFLPSRTIRMP